MMRIKFDDYEDDNDDNDDDGDDDDDDSVNDNKTAITSNNNDDKVSNDGCCEKVPFTQSSFCFAMYIPFITHLSSFLVSASYLKTGVGEDIALFRAINDPPGLQGLNQLAGLI